MTEDLDHRVLLLAPTNRDGLITRALMATAGIAVTVCVSFESLIDELQRGAAAIMVPEEAVSSRRNAALCAVLAKQPPWSDLPVIVLTQTGADSSDLGEAVRTLGNVTLLERPVRVVTLLSAARTALRARDRQYQIRGYLAERQRTEEALRVADQRKDNFLATLGHELRNPLSPLVSALPLLRHATAHDPIGRQVIGIVDRQVEHLVRLVDDLLEVSRITRGMIDVQRATLDLVDAVRAAIEMSRPTIDSAGHALIVDLPESPIAIEGDSVRLTQVFANLLTNAAKYTNRSGHVWVSVTAGDGTATVSVKDDGIGIAHDQLESVFDMFTQIDRSNRRTQGGLGIGLTLARSLVEMHGGTIEARSEGANRGSEFVVRLPRLAMAYVPAAAPSSREPADFPHRRVLVVDDNEDAAETLGALLNDLGATVQVAYSGREAIERVKTFHPDAVLLDIGMPEMDGYEVSRRIRAMPDQHDLLIVALTGWGQKQDRLRSRAAGFDHHIVKPPQIEKLRTVLEGGRLGEAARETTASRGAERAVQ